MRIPAAQAGLVLDRADLQPSTLTADADFEEKHPRGEHGRFGEGDGELPSGWQSETPTNPAFSATYRHGVMAVNVSAKADVPVEVLHHLLARLDALHESDYTGASLKVNVVTWSEMRTKGAAGATFTSPSGGSVIEIGAQVLEPGFADSHGTGATVFKSLPDTVSYADYVVTHEYGHALQGEQDLNRDDLSYMRARGKIMRTEDPPSSYGNFKYTSKDEAYAEAFADWRLNSEPGPLAKALAEHEGWGAR